MDGKIVVDSRGILRDENDEPLRRWGQVIIVKDPEMHGKEFDVGYMLFEGSSSSIYKRRNKRKTDSIKTAQGKVLKID